MSSSNATEHAETFSGMPWLSMPLKMATRALLVLSESRSPVVLLPLLDTFGARPAAGQKNARENNTSKLERPSTCWHTLGSADADVAEQPSVTCGTAAAREACFAASAADAVSMATSAPLDANASHR